MQVNEKFKTNSMAEQVSGIKNSLQALACKDSEGEA